VTATSVFAFILALLAIGRVLRARAVVPETASDTLNVVALYVCMPAAILLNAPQLQLRGELLGLVLVPWLLLAATVALVYPLTRVLRMERPTSACLLMQVPMGNTAFMGYALVPTLAGKEALRYAVVYDQFGTFLVLATYGLFVVAVYGGGRRPTAAAVVKRVVTFPPFLALVFGMTLMPREAPAYVTKPLEILSSALLPIVGLAVGMQLRLHLPRRHIAPLAFAVVAKLALVPLLAVAACAALGVQGDMRAAAVLESAMPTMMTTGALLSMAGLAPELAAAIVGYTTLVSMVTLPLWQRVL